MTSHKEYDIIFSIIPIIDLDVEVDNMVSYRKLFQLLAGREMSKVEFRKLVKISQSTMTKLNHNEYVSLQIIDSICNTLECEIEDVIEVKKNI